MSKLAAGYQVGLSWIPVKNASHIPDSAISVGPGIYIARMRQEGDLIPGKYLPAFNKGFCPRSGKEHEHSECEVLCATHAPGTRNCYKWERASHGQVPKYAIVAGLSADHAPLYVARSEVEGEPVIGKVHQGHSQAYFPHGGKEHARDEYEVLVLVK